MVFLNPERDEKEEPVSVQAPVRTLPAYVELIRVKHWVKNLFVLAPLVFSLNLLDPLLLSRALLAALSFCAASSLVYIINDLFDLRRDREHPRKKSRPLASGRIKILPALVLAACLLLAAAGLALTVNNAVLLVVLAYIVLNLSYSAVLKHLVFFDVMVLAVGFVLRISAGTFAIAAYLSNWIIMTTFFVSLFMGFGKRRQEIVSNRQGVSQIPVLGHYSIELLDFLILISLTLTIMTYSLYAINVSTRDRFGGNRLVFSIPLVVYGLFRYLYVIYKKGGSGDPAEIVLADKGILGAVFLWLVLIIAVLYLKL
jgi:4-hydroxybenzoate polyprenyltransferase